MNIAIPSTFLNDVGSNSTTLVDNLSGVITLILGIVLAVFILSVVVNLLQPEDKNEKLD